VRGLDFSGTERFEILSYLGEGGMGVVYEARDRVRDARVALKTLQKADPELLLRFKNEFRTLQDLRHRNLVSLGELFSENGQWFFTMELVEGMDLRSYVRSDAHTLVPTRVSPFEQTSHSQPPAAADEPSAPSLCTIEPSANYDEARLRSSLAQLADGLGALHAANKVHRDIKPSNVLVTEEGRVVLLDFGLVTEIVRGTQRSDASVVGTTSYMSPEQGASQPVGPAADWYSVGVILHELLTGRLPFDGAPLQVLMEKQTRDPAPPRELVPVVPRDLDALCVKLLARRPEDRPDAEEVALRLRGSVGSNRRRTRTSRSMAPAFVGRDGELGELEDALAGSRLGRPVVVVVRGESGVGKSSLVRRFTDRATTPRGPAESPRVDGEERAQVGSERADAAPGIVLLAGRCYERESLPYKAFDGVIDQLSSFLTKLPRTESDRLVPVNAALLAQLFPVLRRVEAIASAPRPRDGATNPIELRTRAFTALRHLLTLVAHRHPLVVFIDDFQWADADSLALLQDILHPPDPPPFLLIATVRTDPDTGVEQSGDLPQLDSTIEQRVIEVDCLPPKQARELAVALARRAGIEDLSLVDAIVREASGHPLFIQELARHVETAGEPSESLVRLDEALWQRISRLEAPARHVLEIISVAGSPISQDAAAQAAEMGYSEYQRWAALLRVGHLVRSKGSRGSDRIEPYHDRVRESVVRHVDGGTLARHHLRLAMALEAAGAATTDPHNLVRHLDAAGESERAAERAQAAAQIARDMLAFDRAAELYRTALRLGRYPPDQVRELRLRLAEALVHARRGREAADQFLAVAETADPAVRLDCQRQAAIQLLLSGHLERGMAALRAVLADAAIGFPATPRRALLSLLANRARLRLRGLRWRPRHESEVPERDIKRLDVYRAVAMALGVVDNIRGADFQTRFLLAALRAGESRRVVLAFALEAGFAASAGPRALPRARRLAIETARIAKGIDDPLYTAWARTAHGAVAYFGCDLLDADKAFCEAETLFRDQTSGTSWELNTVRSFRVWTLRQLGRCRELRHNLDHYIRHTQRCGDRYGETTLIRTCIAAWLDRGEVDEALDQLARTSWTPLANEYHLQHWYGTRSRFDVELYTRRGDVTLRMAHEQYDRLHASMLGRIALLKAESDWVLGRIALAEAERTGDRGPTIALADRMANRLSRRRQHYDRVFGALLGAGVASMRGQRERAVALLERGAALADERNMDCYSAMADRVRGRLIGGDAGHALLTRADAYTTREEIAEPDRLEAIFCPGFARA
jgi:serine/threonine protein kinase/tetratricopeptide (TPR) repeat protein